MGIGNGDTESRGCVFANFVATKLSTLPFYLLERNGRNSRPTSAFTALYSPRFTLGPRFHERPSVLIFGRHTTRVFASNGRFPSNYVDGAEFSAFSFLTTRVSRARVNRVDIIYFSEISFFFDTYARANGFYLDGSRKGDVCHGHWKVQVMIFSQISNASVD